MGDVDDLQVAEEAAAQRAEAKEQKARERRASELREEPLRSTASKGRSTLQLAIEQVHPGDNIRLDLPEIQELALSIREVGLLTPLIVRPWNTGPDADGALPAHVDQAIEHYRLIAGHRRHAALVALVDAGVDGFDSASCEVRDGLSEAETYALMLTENVQRVPLEPVQAARALRLLLDLNEGMDAAALARSLGLRPAWAQTHLKLLDLPQEVQDRLEAGDLTVTIADLLRRGQATGRINEAQVVELANKVASGEITSKQLKAEAGPPPKPNTQAPKTVVLGADGQPIDPRDAEAMNAGAGEHVTWVNEAGDVVPRPPTPLTAASPRPAGAGVSQPGILQPASGMTMPTGGDAPVIPYEDRLDAYLLGRALTEWADDEYLDEIGIDRVQCEAYAALLGFEERIQAIRHLSATLMNAQDVPVGAR